MGSDSQALRSGGLGSRELTVSFKPVTAGEAKHREYMPQPEKGEVMSKAGDIFENPITDERAVIRVGTEESGGELLVADLYVSPGGRVAAEHVHPILNEWFTPVSGRVGFRVNGQESVAEIGRRLHISPGTTHDWWNVGKDEAHVVVEVRPAARFEEAISTTF